MRQDVEDLLKRLESTVQKLTWVMIDCDEEDLNTAPADEEWSPLEILGHVKALDDIVTFRIAAILTKDTPLIPDFDVDGWAKIAGYRTAPLDQTLHSYQRHRSELVWQLRQLPDEAWDRHGKHESKGDLSLFDLVRIFLEHEEEHLAQLEAAFGDEEE